MLVGNKSDLEVRAVSRTQASKTAQEWEVPYHESSARYNTNIKEVFVDLSRQIMHKIGHGFETSQADKTQSKSGGCFPSSTVGGPQCIVL